MKATTYLVCQVREWETGWNPAAIGRIERQKKTYVLRDIAGRERAKGSLAACAAAGRRLAENMGYIHSAAYTHPA